MNYEKLSKRSVKYLIFLIMIFLVISFCFNIFFQYNIIKKIKDKVNMNYQNIVGALVLEYPEKELDIVKAILNKEDRNLNIKGEEILKKYGYNNSIENFLNTSFEREIKDIIGGNIIFFLSLVFIIFLIFIFCNNHTKKYFDIIDEFLNSFLKRDFSYSRDIIVDGKFGEVINNFNRLGKLLDIEIKKLENEKESSKEAITDLGHQIKTPLASLNLYNGILEDDDLSKDEKLEFLDENKKAIAKLEELFKSLINISKLEKEIIKVKMENGNIKETLIKAINSVYLKAELKNISINLDEIYDYELIHDRKWTEEAIINILDNAIKYNRCNGKINIRFESGISYFKIHILDTGIGINLYDYNKIFKRFYRGTSIEIENIEGSGVGLYLSRKILELQGGNIIVDSKINKGSKFSLFLQNCK